LKRVDFEPIRVIRPVMSREVRFGKSTATCPENVAKRSDSGFGIRGIPRQAGAGSPNSCNSDDSKFVKSFFEDSDGLIDIDNIYQETDIESNYFISGPPVMIKSFKKSLVDKGTLAVNVLTDDWE
jgi:hypothetical protein